MRTHGISAIFANMLHPECEVAMPKFLVGLQFDRVWSIKANDRIAKAGLLIES